MVGHQLADVLLVGVDRRDQLRLLADQRLVGQHVEAGGGELAAAQRLDQGAGIDDAAAGGVDQDGALLHAGEGFGVDQVLGLRQRRHVQGDDVGAGQQFLHIHIAKAELARGEPRPA